MIDMADDPRPPDDPIPSDLVRQDESFADLVQDFVEGLGQRVSEMQEAVSRSDFLALRSLAHQLKGSGGGYGYAQLTELASRLEQDAMAETLPPCQQALDELKVTVSRVVVRLD
ncbi:MAG: Hpt domain-containing protein [bacterium]|nr:Hpt domain-containing protein [bacterium]